MSNLSRRRPRWHALTTLTAILVLTGSFILPAAADTPRQDITADSPSNESALKIGEEFLRNQQKLGELTTWILDQPNAAERGYISQVNDAPNLATRLLWYGSDELQSAALARAAELGITATVEQRPHSLPQIEAIADALWSAEDTFLDYGFELKSVEAVTADSAAITVNGILTDSMRLTVGSKRYEDTLHALASGVAGTPINVNTSGNVELTNGSRQQPTAPFWAGSAIERYLDGVYELCSTGFTIKYQGINRATTARHCDALPYTGPEGGQTLGNSLTTTQDGLRVLQASGGARMFDGAWNVGADTGLDKGLYGLFDVGLNDYVCTSGGSTGSHCNNKVVAMFENVMDGYGNFSTIKATQQTAGQISNGGGDSGGAVFMPYYPPNDYNVSAVGMIQAGRDEVAPTCGVGPFTGISCYRSVLFSSMRTILNSMPGSSLATF